MKRAEIVLPGRYSAYTALHDFVVTFAESQRYSAIFQYALQLSLKEAFVNAVRHGNREEEHLTVTCTLTAEANSLLASIRDCGAGFNPLEMADPTEPQNLLKPSGRGLYIIRSIAEIIALECSGDGSTLQLRYIPW
ncbi:MAG: ATP-binding protein [Chlorobium sp.]|nr:MAG: ATP-binding protein [Chlorobium sp.]